MKYGRIRIEDGHLAFNKHMRLNYLPCKDIMWGYLRREATEGTVGKQLISNYLVIVTRRKKRYKFDMTEKEVHNCLELLKVLNPDMAVGFPKGGRIALQSLANTRDLGALLTEDGRHIIPRKLLRSGDLYHLSLSDQAVLAEGYRLKTVIDFRTNEERKRKPDTILSGVEFYHIPIFDEETMGITREAMIPDMLTGLQEAGEQFMLRQYENMIRDQYSVKQYARFLDVLLHHENGAVLWHCSAGKDRAGVGTALLLCVLGVPKETILEDYMRTNHYLQPEMEYMERYIQSRRELPQEALKNLKIFFTVREEYLNRVFQVIEEDYGSVERFIRKALYLTPKTIENLKEKYLI